MLRDMMIDRRCSTLKGLGRSFCRVQPTNIRISVSRHLMGNYRKVRFSSGINRTPPAAGGYNHCGLSHRPCCSDGAAKTAASLSGRQHVIPLKSSGQSGRLPDCWRLPRLIHRQPSLLFFSASSLQVSSVLEHLKPQASLVSILITRWSW